MFSTPYSRSSPRAARHTEDFLAALVHSSWRTATTRNYPHSLGLVRSYQIAAAPGLYNPDNQYSFASIDPEGQYVLEGVRGTHTSLYFQLLSEDAQLAVGKSLQILDDDNMGLQANEAFRIYLGGARRPGKWFALPAQARSVLVRQTFSDWGRESASRVSLRRLDQRPPAQLREPEKPFVRAARYLRRSAELWAQVFPRRISALPENQIVTPRPTREGLPSQRGSLFRYRIPPQQALVVTVRRSPALYQAIQVGTPWFATPDWVHRQCSLNHTQAHLDPDGSFRFVIALEDPGLQNWLDPDGEAEGTSFLRWQGLERPLESAEHPRLDIVPVTELEAWLRRQGSTMPRVAAPRPPRYDAPLFK